MYKAQQRSFGSANWYSTMRTKTNYYITHKIVLGKCQQLTSFVMYFEHFTSHIRKYENHYVYIWITTFYIFFIHINVSSNDTIVIVEVLSRVKNIMSTCYLYFDTIKKGHTVMPIKSCDGVCQEILFYTENSSLQY